MRRWRGVGRLATAVAVTAVVTGVLAGCTDTGPEEPPTGGGEPPAGEDDEAPSPPAELGVVLPPRDEIDAALVDELAEHLSAFDRGGPLEIRGVRVEVPESGEFIDDVVNYLAEQGSQIVCVIGPQAAASAERAAEVHRGARFCAAPADDRPDSTALRLQVRAAELGHVVGLAARRHADVGPVAVLTGGGDVDGGAFSAGLEAGLAGVDVVTSSASAPFEERVRDVLADEPTVVIVDGAAEASAVVDLVGDAALLVGPDAVLADADDDVRLLTWRVRWEEVLAMAMPSLLGEGPGPVSFGAAESVFAVMFGGAAGDRLADDVAEAFDAFADGTRDPHATPPGKRWEPPEDDEDGGAAADDDE